MDGFIMEIPRRPAGSITFQTMVPVTVPAGTSMLEAEDLPGGRIPRIQTA